ncbi:multidrug effflux MFS transporter [Geodermatophilus sp. CPCC 206100]|uniref:multidrug effflux MFS transporter n=1 Tax=Geodermatophilus sp. CPCC 206100 TaxID=3020054 RepID=UPI003B00ECAA
MTDPSTPHRGTALPAGLTGRGGLRRDLTVLLGVLSAFGPLSMDLYLPALPSVEDEFAASQSAVQLTVSAAAVGLALGQLLAGPLSDRYGRRGPVLLGVGAWTLASVLCALAPSVWVLVTIRLLQGLGGAAGIVLARAIVRDLLEGVAAARAFAMLASIMAAAPVLAPLAGGLLLNVTDWRGVFGTLTLIGLLVVGALLWRLPETLPVQRRVVGGLRTTLANARELLRRRAFVAAVLAQGLGFGTLFTYISTSSFVLQGGYGLSPQQFALAFGANGIGIVLAGQLSRALVGRVSPRLLLRAGLAGQAVGGAVLVVAALAGWPLGVVLPALFLVTTSTGLLVPNATALAMADAGHVAGTASALLGVVQFGLGALVAPLAGLGPSGALLPMALVMLGSTTLGLLAAAVVPRGRARSDAPGAAADPAPGEAATRP